MYFGNNKEDCEKLNWENKIDKMNTLFFSWGKRNLTILGKIMIIKALVIPIFTLLLVHVSCQTNIEKELKVNVSNSYGMVNQTKLKETL